MGTIGEAIHKAKLSAKGAKEIESRLNRITGTLFCSTCGAIIGTHGEEDPTGLSYYVTEVGRAHVQNKRQCPGRAAATINEHNPVLPPFPYDYNDPRTIHEQYMAWAYETHNSTGNALEDDRR